MIKTIFEHISSNEIKFNYKGFDFILKEISCGILGSGKTIQLYQINETEKIHLQEIGWTKWDSRRFPGNAIIKHLTNWHECQIKTLKYIDNLLK